MAGFSADASMGGASAGVTVRRRSGRQSRVVAPPPPSKGVLNTAAALIYVADQKEGGQDEYSLSEVVNLVSGSTQTTVHRRVKELADMNNKTLDEIRRQCIEALRASGRSVPALDAGDPVEAASVSRDVAIRAAVDAVLKDGLLQVDARRGLSRQGITIAKATFKRYVKHVRKRGMLRLPQGREAVIAFGHEEQIADVIRLLRRYKFAITATMVKAWANEAIAGTEYEKRFVHSRVTQKWYRGFLKRHHLLSDAVTPLEEDREKWVTSANLKIYYDNLADKFVEVGIAEWEDGCDVDAPASRDRRRIRIVKPERVVSFDETRTEIDMTELYRNVRTVKVEGGDADVRAVKGGLAATLVAGGIGDGGCLAPHFVFASASGFDVDWVVGAADGRSSCTAGRATEATFDYNAKGSITNENIVTWVEMNLVKHWDDLSPKNPVVLICDGVGPHVSNEFIYRCKEKGIEVILRPPHTSHVTQNEDIVHFGLLKPLFEAAKQ